MSQQLPAAPQLPQRVHVAEPIVESAAADDSGLPSGMLMLAAMMTPLLADVEPAHAGNPLLTGKTVSLVRSLRHATAALPTDAGGSIDDRYCWGDALLHVHAGCMHVPECFAAC